MNIFILSTGRCGSVTFVEACKFIENFSSAHESKVDRFGDARLAFSDNHIESDNRLSWFLGRLDKQYGNDAFYVHLTRNNESTAKSYSKRMSSGLLMKAYMYGIYMGLNDEQDPYDLALDMCVTVNANIEFFLKDKSNKMTMSLENVSHDFPLFWQKIGAKGNLEKAMEQWQCQHNATKIDDYRPPHFLVRVFNKIFRAVVSFPNYLKKV